MQSSQKLHVNEITKHQITTASNQEEWNNIIKVLKRQLKKTQNMTIKRKRKKRPKHSAPFIDSERYQHQFKLHQRRTKKEITTKRKK